MSANLVSDKTINIVVTYFEHLCASNRWYQEKFENMGYYLDRREDFKKLGKDMRQLNIKALEERYGEGNAKEFGDIEYRYEPVEQGFNTMQAYKSLRNWIYQCSEGDIIKPYSCQMCGYDGPTNRLYNFMSEQMDMLANTIVQGLTEYKQCNWTI